MANESSFPGLFLPTQNLVSEFRQAFGFGAKRSSRVAEFLSDPAGDPADSSAWRPRIFKVAIGRDAKRRRAGLGAHRDPIAFTFQAPIAGA
jgi:hypothetical protein